MKKCTRCEETKPLDSFIKQRHKPDGRYSICKECQREKRRQKDEEEYELIWKALTKKF